LVKKLSRWWGGLLLFWLLGSPVLAAALDWQGRKVTLAMTSEPPDLNSTTSTDAVSIMVLNHVMEGLLTYDPDGNLVAGVAERWQLREDGARFWLRKDARWSDGRPLTAHDFVFAWRQVLAPATASQYAFILFPLANAQAINEGQLPPERLGVQALDRYTLEVRFSRPCPYFPGLTAFATLYPVNEAFYRSRGERYAADAGDLLYNGPFRLTQWVHGASLKMEKNQHYWNREQVWLNEIDVPYITEDGNARFNLFRDNHIALADNLGEQTLGGALRERMQIKSFLDGGIFYLEFNHRPDRVTRNLHLRKAIQAVFNANDFVYKVLGSPGTYPAYTLFPRWMKGERDLFKREYPPRKPTVDIQRARDYLAAAKRELGVDSLPALTLLADDSAGGNRSAEFLQTLFKQTLGLEIKVDVQIFKQRIAKMTSGDFDLVMAGWGPDYNDLLTYADLFMSVNLNNRGRYSSQVYDHWVEVAQNTVDVKSRMRAFGQLQQILFDDVVILPMYERGKVYVQHPNLRGVIRRAVGGDPNFNYAVIEP